jgi:hypothetical protein
VAADAAALHRDLGGARGRSQRLSAVLVSPFAGRYIGKSDARDFTTVAFIIFAISYFMRADYPQDPGLWALPRSSQTTGIGYLLSSLDLFYFSAWLVICVIPLCWLVRWPAGSVGAVASNKERPGCA